MTLPGTVTNVATACCGDHLRACWRVWFDLDDPHALADTGMARPAHPWVVDLPRGDAVPPCAAGDRIAVKRSGRNVVLTRVGGATVTIKAEVPGPYDPERRVN